MATSTSVSCQEETHAPQQILSMFDHRLVSQQGIANQGPPQAEKFATKFSIADWWRQTPGGQ
jgi:hypothetical protein